METLHPCTRCNSLPSGIDGHSQLHCVAQPAPGHRAGSLFRCAECGRDWVRRYVGGGEFGWALEPVTAAA